MALRSVSRSEVLLVNMTAGPRELNLCSADQIVTVDAVVYSPDPRLAAALPERTGLFDEEFAEVTSSANYGFVTDNILSSGIGQVDIQVSVLVIEGGDYRKVHKYDGLCSSIKLNPPGQPGSVVWTVGDAKLQADAVINAIALDTCENKGLGKRFCNYDVAGQTLITTITEVDYNLITIPNLPDRITGFWQDGIVRSQDGIERKIQLWDQGDVFVLSQPVPRIWQESIALGSSVAAEIEPGCNLLPDNCLFFEQQANNLSLGINIPPYHTSFELPR